MYIGTPFKSEIFVHAKYYCTKKWTTNNDLALEAALVTGLLKSDCVCGNHNEQLLFFWYKIELELQGLKNKLNFNMKEKIESYKINTLKISFKTG